MCLYMSLPDSNGELVASATVLLASRMIRARSPLIQAEVSSGFLSESTAMDLRSVKRAILLESDRQEGSRNEVYRV